MKYWLVSLLFVTMSAYAALYRSIDEYGNVSYSDMPSENAELIELKELSTYTPPPFLRKLML